MEIPDFIQFAFFIPVYAYVSFLVYCMFIFLLEPIRFVVTFILRKLKLKNSYKHSIYMAFAIFLFSPVLLNGYFVEYVWLPNGICFIGGILMNSFDVYGGVLDKVTSSKTALTLQLIPTFFAIAWIVYGIFSHPFKEDKASEPPQALELPGGDL